MWWLLVDYQLVHRGEFLEICLQKITYCHNINILICHVKILFVNIDR